MADMPSTSGAPEDDVFSFDSAASKEFPLCPEGPSEVVVVRALFTMKKKQAKYLKPNEDPNKEYPNVSLMLQTDKMYEDEGQKKPHNVFYGMKISDHKKATMYDFFHSAFGIDIPLSADKKIKLANKIETDKEGKKLVHLPQFENIRFGVIVKHERSEDGSKTYDAVDSVFATADQKRANAALFSAQA